MKVGIEVEMIIYSKKKSFFEMSNTGFSKAFNEFHESLRWLGSIHNDGSLEYCEDIDLDKWDRHKMEVSSVVFPSMDDLLRAFKNVFIKDNISINEYNSDADIIIYFNRTTGTHIHYSCNMIRSKGKIRPQTVEKNFLNKNPKNTKNLVDYIYNNCKYKELVADMKRYYANSTEYNSQKYCGVNIINDEYGTLEFRLFHLHGVTKSNVINVLKHYLQLIHDSVELVYSDIKSKCNELAMEYDDILNSISDKNDIPEELLSLKKGIKSLKDTSDKYYNSFDNYYKSNKLVIGE